jgi:aminoglycoside phosphotransferase (APT) family kinase protein
VVTSSVLTWHRRCGEAARRLRVFEQSDIAHYLLSLGVVKPRSVLEEDFAVVDASRRNCVFLATTSAGPTFVVKQAPPASAAPLAHEARILRLLAAAPELAAHVPAVVHEEPGGGCIVLRTAGGGRDWGDHQGRFPRVPARILGRVLAVLHGLGVEAPANGSEAAWGLLLPEPPHDLVLELSAGAQDVVARIQGSDELCGRLAELRSAAAGEALVHGDLRWDNCLALPAPGARRRTRVLLVDWELAGRADPAFDAGSVLAEYLRVWVGSVPIVEAVDPGRLVARARHPLGTMRPAVDAFWSAYGEAAARPPALRRVIEMTAVRLLQTAVERAQGLSAPTAHIVTLLQLADNMLRRPDDAASGLLGLRA